MITEDLISLRHKYQQKLDNIFKPDYFITELGIARSFSIEIEKIDRL